MVVLTEWLSLHKSTSDWPARDTSISLAFFKISLDGSMLSFTSWALLRETIVWLAPVSSMQFMSRLSEGECAGPSQSGIFGVGLL